MTSDFEWLQFKAGVEKRIQKSVLKDENSNSLDSLEYQSIESSSDKESETEIIPEEITQNTDDLTDDEMNPEKKIENSASDEFSIDEISTDEISTSTQYNCSEIVEETEILATDSITESVDIRISPRNSTVELINFDAIDDFPTEFSLVADVEIKMEGSDKERVISTIETPVKNVVASKKNTGEGKLVTFADDCDNLLDEKTGYFENEKTGYFENEKHHAIPCKIINGDPQENDSYESNVKTPNSENINGQKKSKRDARKIGNGVSFTVESKIAQEIKEMKQREEDLRKMREIQAKEIPITPESPTPMPKKEPKVEPLVKPEVKAIIPEFGKKPTVKTQIVNGQSYKIASVFGRKDASKKNESSPKVDKKPSATYESPIEREIRIVKQREEELKREREHALKVKRQLESCLINPDLSDDDKETNDTFASVSICSDSSFDSGTKLSPDQKQFDGSMSPTTINNKINGLYYNSSNAESTCSLDSISHIEKSTSFNGLQKVFSHNGNQMRSPSPDSSSNSSISKMSFPFNGQKPGLVATNKNVNMERFIASKGKQIVFKNSSPTIAANGSSEYSEIKPPQIKKSDQKSQRKFVSAASKIQSELNEMKEREEELR